MAHPERVRVDPAPPKPDNPVTFEQVLREELRCVNGSRPKRNVGSEAHADNLTGLAFSGGGIRSATFNLWILQALAEKGLLRQFDYLSTVSGGGYIGSWLAALTHRFTKEFNVKFDEVEKALCPSKYEPDRRSEPGVLHWLRLYSNYLTPHKGLISGDTWAMLGTWTRNVLLNQTILALMFMSVFVLCQSAFLASISMAINVVSQSPSTAIQQTWFQRVKITATVMVPFVVACVLLNGALWLRSDFDAPTWMWALAGAAFYFVVWGVVAIMAWVRRLWRKGHGKP